MLSKLKTEGQKQFKFTWKLITKLQNWNQNPHESWVGLINRALNNQAQLITFCIQWSWSAYLLKWDLRKNDQNLNIVFISCDWPIPTFFLSVRKMKGDCQLHIKTLNWFHNGTVSDYCSKENVTCITIFTELQCWTVNTRIMYYYASYLKREEISTTS